MHHSRNAGDTSLATVEGIALFVMQTEGIVPVPRPSWLPTIVPWTRTTTGATYHGLQMRGDGIVEPMGPELAAMLPKQWQLLLADPAHGLPDDAILRYGVSMTGPDAAFIDYDADAVQWVGAWTVHCEQRVGVRRASWTIQAHPRRLERLRGLQRAMVPLRSVHKAS